MVWLLVLIGMVVLVEFYLILVLNEDINVGMVFLNIKIDGCVKWKVGLWVFGCYWFFVNCLVFIFFFGQVVGGGFVIKDQFVQLCVVDV